MFREYAEVWLECTKMVWNTTIGKGLTIAGGVLAIGLLAYAGYLCVKYRKER